MRKLVIFTITIILLASNHLASQNGSADLGGPIGTNVLQESDKLKGNIQAEQRNREDLDASEFGVEDPWNDKTRQRVYNWSGKPSLLLKIEGILRYELPSPLSIGDPLREKLYNLFPDDQASRIAEYCNKRFSRSWNKISCISLKINAFVTGRNSEVKFSKYRTGCTMIAVGFKKAFLDLRIPGTWVSKIDASGPSMEDGHIANVIMFKDVGGRVYSYVIDVSLFPLVLFPLNDAAIKFHHALSHDSFTDAHTLPAISDHPFNGYKAAQ